MDGGRKSAEELRHSLKTGIIADILFSIALFVIGIFSGSLALISNGVHGLTDALSLLISFAAAKISMREATKNKTYGYGRTTIISALINSVMLILFAAFIFAEAYHRIINPVPLNGVVGFVIVITAILGILVSSGIAAMLRKHGDDLNAKSAFLHMGYDAVAYFSTLLAGVMIVITRNAIFDPIISILIGVLMVIGAWGIMKEASQILLEGVPKWINTDDVREAIKRNPAVKSVHDLHVWAISSQYAALSCHVIINANSIRESVMVVSRIKMHLRDDFKIEHATIEVEIRNTHKREGHR